MERRLNLAALMGLALLFLATTAAAAGSGSGTVPGKKFCVRFGGVDDSYLALSQQPSSYTPQSGKVDGAEYDETCYDLWYDTSVENYYDEDKGAYTTSIETHCSGNTCIDAFSYLASVMQSAHSGIKLLTDIDFGGVNADSSCVVAFRPLPNSSYGLEGQNNTIKNLCFVLNTLSSAYTADYEDAAGSGDSYGVGFFSETSGGSIYDLNFENVYIKVENEDPYYSVPTGVLVGKFGNSWPSITNVSLKNVKVVAAYAGALVGSVTGRVEIDGVSGENVEIFAAEGTVASSIEDYNFEEYSENLTVRLGGLVGMATLGAKITNVGILDLKVHSDEESISLLPEVVDPVCDYDEDPDCVEPSVTGTPRDMYGYVGGLVGALAADNADVTIVNTYTTGDISYKGGDYYVGFLAGEMNLNVDNENYAGYNYHYGTTDYQAENVVGWLYMDGDDLSSTWINGYGSLGGSHPLGGGLNYRNSISGKIEPTNCSSSNTPVYMGPSYGYRCAVLDGSNYGGYVAPDSMKTGSFAWWFNGASTELNIPSSSAGYQKWSRKDGVNSGLPVFATASLKPIYQVSFTVDENTYASLPETTREALDNVEVSVDLSRNGSKLKAFTNYTGKLANTTWAEIAAQVDNNDYNWNYQDKSGRTLPLVVKASSVYGSDFDLSLTGKKSVTVQYGFVESGNGDTFYSVESYAESHADLLGGDPYFMGDPVTEITSDSAWSRIPYLAVYNEHEGAYQYFEFSLRKKSGCYEEDWGYDEPVELCFYISVDVSSVGRFFTDGLSEFSDGDTLYVVYSDYPSTYDPSANTSAPGGYMFVADLHGNGFGMETANVQVKGVDGNGDRVLFGYSEYLNIRSEAVEDVLDALSGVSSTMMNVPYSPYVTVDYPSTAWESVEDVVALVVVGYLSASSADDWVVGVTGALADTRMEGKLPKDTLAALESPDEILREIRANGEETVQYVRYLAADKDGNLDLTNLFAALELAKKAEYRFEYPIFVGFLPQIAEIRYHVTFDVESKFYAGYGDYSSLFVAHTWVDKKGVTEATYTKEQQYGEFTNVYDWGLVRTDACYRGAWSFNPSESRGYEELSIYGIYALEEYDSDDFVVKNKDGSRSLNLYASWEADPESCVEGWPERAKWDDETESWKWNNAIVEDKSELGNIVLQQVWNGDTLRHKSTSLDEHVVGIYVPRADSLYYTFEVFADGYAGYEVDGDITFTKTYLDGRTPETTKLKEGNLLTISASDLASSNMEFSANYTYKKFNIVFETGKTDVLYGENSDSVGTYKLNAEDDAIDLPFWVYTADQCVEGWTHRAEFDILDRPEEADADWNPDCKDEPACEEYENDRWWVFDQFNFELSEMLVSDNGNRQEKYPLYAKWVDAKTCVEELSYKQTKLTESENGSVAFKEIRKDSTGKIIGTQLHKFAKDGTMLLPYYVKGSSFVVQGLPAKDYILDSLVMTLDGKKYVYHEGDTLAGSITKATFAAYFMPENPTPAKFVTSKLLQSGSAIRFEFATNEFGASGASVKIVLEDDDGKVVADSVIQISKTPYEGSWDYYPLRAGTYLLTATVANSKSSDVFEQDFEVKAEIASAAEGGWRMLSLSNVVMDSVTWDDDIRFYWWDDTRNTGAFWQYQRLNRDDKVDDLTGYWYSSLEGRPLVMKKDMAAPKDPVVWNMDSVYTGWNMVANPYGWYVDLYGENPNEKKAATEKSSIEFYSWNDSLGDYEPVDVIGPYEAVWAKVTGPSQWKLPSKPAFVATVDAEGEENVVEPLKKTVELASGGKGWAIRAVLRDAKGKRDSWNFMGVSESGWASEEPPSGMGDHVNLSIKDGNKSLAKSFKKAAGDSYEWTVSLEASGDRTGYLHFEGVRDLNAAGLKVFVTVDGTTTQMAENDTLKVSIGSMAKTATVRVAPSARTVVAQKLNGLRAFQAGNSLQVGFQVSESLAGARAYVEILDMKGKVLSSVSGTAVSGSNALTLQTPKSGLYMVRVRVGSKQAAGSVAIK